MIKTTICEIERYAVHDGPGIRTVVFLKGCPLKCLWCSNPETQRKQNEIYYNSKKCIMCERCVDACKEKALRVKEDRISIDREKCTSCGACTKECPMGALNLVGKFMSVQEVFQEVNKDMVFYQQSQGGITISGGEVLIHGDFTVALLKECKKNYINTAIETSGFGNYETLKSISVYADLIMFDIKHTNNDTHKKLTGVENKTILDNLNKLSKIHRNIIIRVPLITGLNDSIENIENTVKIAEQYGIKEVHLLPYHSLGKEKYKQLQKKYALENIQSPEEIHVNKLKKLIESYSIKCVIGG
ncbi:glycyl-radical enzyme activating protein [Clostridium ganghwense]|uniref:Glycyl-radical enzyme activating protein n=1 Tax=Clostridium ganghwense TaxID=312089 RepID=A0ABT4CUP4_9CLOT|nr:glycyl-radical enzyme activating protein [Clostridium ganghwense]MCY6372805.1 glycyl-radical enzyme activating protein [Clostridium ganghwense]